MYKSVIKNLHHTLAFTLLLILLTSSCSSVKKERREMKKFVKLTSGFKPTVYKNISKKTVTPLVQKYNSDKPDSLKINEDDVRMLIGFMMAITKKYGSAVTEANIIIENKESNYSQYIAYNLLSSIMFEKGWRRIAIKEELKATSLLKTNENIKTSSFRYIFSELILAKKNIHKLAYDEALINFANLSNGTGIDWPQKLCAILLNIKKGDIDKAKTDYEVFMKDDKVPANIKKDSAKIITKLISNPKNITKLNLISADYFSIFLSQLKLTKKLETMLRFADNIIVAL